MDNIIPMILIAVVGTVLLTVLVLMKSRPYYTASAKIILEPKIPQLLYVDPERQMHSFEDWMRTQEHESVNYSVLERAVTSYQKQGFRWQLPDESLHAASDRLRAKLKLTQINNTQIMEFELSGPKAEGLAELINAVLQGYKDVKELRHYYAVAGSQLFKRKNETVEDTITRILGHRESFTSALNYA